MQKIWKHEILVHRRSLLGSFIFIFFWKYLDHS